MRIAICDDEKDARELIAAKVRELYPSEDIFVYSSGDEIINDAELTDILLLDIQMPGLNGMQTAEKMRQKHRETIIIFVTAIENYVFQAFDVGAFHYLVKPFSDSKFKEVLNNAAKQYQKKKMQPAKIEEKNIIIKSGGIHIKINLDEVMYAEVFNRKIMIHKKNEDIEYYGKMSELESSAGSDFFRTHRAYLIHFKYVEKYDVSTVYLEKGKALMAKKNYPEFVKRYLKYNQKKGKKL